MVHETEVRFMANVEKKKEEGLLQIHEILAKKYVEPMEEVFIREGVKFRRIINESSSRWPVKTTLCSDRCSIIFYR